jgi:FtsP/CotA-like multicopper oxidase with cupredoxin domain
VRPAISREWIGPGSRREVLLTVPQSAAVGDVYSVTWCEPATDIFHSPTDELQPDETCNGTSQVVATLSVVEGEGKSAEFGEGDTFADLEGFGLAADLWAQPADVYRTIKFTQEFSVAEGTKFMIDVGDGEGSRQFEMDEICDPPIEATLGSVEEWTIENWTTDLHTFHMHVVPFQVDPASMSSRYGSGAFYQDNVILPLGESANNPTNPNEARSPGVLKLRMRHDDYVGTSVFHCHLLEHEDYGMMTAVSVRAE